LDIDGWLGRIGLAQYAEMFRGNDIDGELLGRLTNDDLKDIGVASFGHRKKLLEAIAELGGAPAATPAPRPVVQAPVPARVAPPLTSVSVEAAGERRYLTVMFCDLVGSTGISAQLDAEEWRDLVGGYLDAASAAVTDMGGYVAKKLGDGILALFGYPVAHENDAERAARAALSIQRALGELNRKNAGTGKPELAARIGLDTGPAVVDAAGEIYGDVANVAARVQALAEPGAVLVTARVQRQIVGLFVAEERGTHALKGVPEPMVLFKLVRASGGGRRSGQRNLTPLVGRDDEMTMLVRRWERARQGDGQLVMIVGEPGLGKSRLMEEFHTRLSETPHTWVEWSCSQLLQNTPLHPIAEWGRQRFGGADVPAERRLADLESSLAQVKLDPAENVPLVAPLLDIPLPKERVPTLAAEELRRRQLAALTSWVMAGAKVQPVVLAFEDLHWADPTTLDVLRGIAERGALAPLFIVATTRPEFRPPWGMRSHHGTMSLAPLDRDQVRDMVAELSACHALSREVVEGVAARTGGVPLFVEEVTRLLLERGAHGGGIEAIPPTLQQSLMARLDRLGPAREVAQIGAVIGRGFSYALLRDVADMEDGPLQAALERLAEADIVLVQGLPPESDYRFKHALIQDAAYENLLRSRRQVLHRRVAETVRDRFAGTAAAEPEVLAYHFTQAGMTDAAIEWWGRAGDQALRRSAFQEAIAHLGKAIEMADKAVEGVPRAAATPATASVGQRLKLQTSYGQALMWSKGYASEETKAAVSRARELAGNVDDPSERFATYYGRWAGHLLRAELNSALETATAFLRDAENAGRPTEAAVAQRFLGLTILWQSDFIEASARLNEALRIYDSERDHDAKFRFGTDTGAVATVHLAQANWLLGNVDQARELMQEAVTRAGATTHAPTMANVDYFRAVFEMLRGDTGAALRTADSLLELTRQHGISAYATLGTMCSGWARAQLGDREAGVAEFREALATYTGQGNKGHVPLHQGLLAELEAEGQDAEGASSRIDGALALAGETGEHWTDSFLHRVRGEIVLKRDPENTAPAEEAFLTAVAVAQQHKARSFELRAALSLAKLYQSTGRAGDAHAVLAPALEGLSPTPEFPEIEEAQALLETLTRSDEIKTVSAARQQRAKLHVALGNALIAARGYGAPETTAAFARASEAAALDKNAPEHFSALYGLWSGGHMRGELAAMREHAAAFLRDVERRPHSPEAGVAHRINGITSWFAGEFAEARGHYEKALAIFDPAATRIWRIGSGKTQASARWHIGRWRCGRSAKSTAPFGRWRRRRPEPPNLRTPARSLTARCTRLCSR
jgi:class 3 adenylate cyclase/predicted ATPase